jgi:oligosaccharide repeat unit polymerase
MNAFLILISMFLLMCGTYFIWPSRYNIPAHISLALYVVAWVIPVVFTNYGVEYETYISSFAAILGVGGAFYIAGMIFGSYTFPKISCLRPINLLNSNFERIRRSVDRKISVWMIIGILLMIFSFAKMGFVPAMADDPIQAKFFRGSYQDAYKSVAVFFRTGKAILLLLIPIAFCSWFENRKKTRLLVLNILAIILMGAAFTRTAVLMGTLIALGIYVAGSRKKYLFAIYITALVLVHCLGATSYYLMFSVFKMKTVGAMSQTLSFSELIAIGSPDLRDNLKFLTKFMQSPEYTYGRTFIGGLVPYHFYWNPAVWTLHVILPNVDVNSTYSGGLRIPMPVWGYTAFGRIGVPVVCFLNGVAKGGLVRYARTYIEEQSSPMHACMVVSFLMYAYVFLYNTVEISIYELPAVIVLLSLLNSRRKSKYIMLGPRTVNQGA